MNQLLSLQSLEVSTEAGLDRASSLSLKCTGGSNGANSGISFWC